MKDLSGDGGVIKTVVQEGKGWEHPKGKDEVIGELFKPVPCISATIFAMRKRYLAPPLTV